MSGMKISHASVVFAAAIIVASCVSFAEGAEIPIPRGRPRINTERTTLVADNGALLRGCVASHERESLEQLKLVGLNAVHDYAEGCDLNYPAEGSRAPGYRVEAIDKAVKLTKELGLYFIMTIGNDPGKFNKEWALDFWKFYAPRYKDEPHVIYEIHNEPVKWAPPYNSPKANPPGAVEMNAECWKLIRSLAPDTPILVFSYSQTPWDSAKHILDDIALFDRCIGLDAKNIWGNTAISFHAYAGSRDTESPVKDVLKAGYPMVMTEYYSSPWGGDRNLGRNDCELTGFLEEERVSWLSFLYAPPGMWGLNVCDDRRFKIPTELAGITWKPDYGTWPKPRKLIKDKDGKAFETGTWKDKRIAGSALLKASGAEKDEFVLVVREPGYYRLNLACTGGGGEFAVTFRDKKLCRLSVPHGETNVSRTVLMDFGRGVLGLKRISGRAKAVSLDVAPRDKGPLADGIFKIVNKATGLALASNGSVYQDEYTDDNAHHWEFKHLGAGQYRIVTKEGGGVLNRIFFGSDKVNVVWYGWDSPSRDQRWLLRPGSEKGFFRIAPVATGYDVKPEKPESGAKLQQGNVPFAGEDERQWKVEKP